MELIKNVKFAVAHSWFHIGILRFGNGGSVNWHVASSKTRRLDQPNELNFHNNRVRNRHNWSISSTGMEMYRTPIFVLHISALHVFDSRLVFFIQHEQRQLGYKGYPTSISIKSMCR